MEIAEIGVGSRLGMCGLKNRGLMEVSDDPSNDDFVLVISKDIREKWYLKCFKDEVFEAVNRSLAEEVRAWSEVSKQTIMGNCPPTNQEKEGSLEHLLKARLE